MTRFISFTSAALFGSLSLLCGSTASAQFGFDDFVDDLGHEIEHEIQEELFGDDHHGRGRGHHGRGHHDGGHFDDHFFDDHHDDGHHYDDHHYFDDHHYDDHYYHGGHQHYGGYQYFDGHQHYNRRPIIVDEGLPYPGLVSENFGGMGHIHELAMNVRYLANHITFDMWYNYQFNPGFEEIYAKCYQFRNLSYAIHDMEHTGEHVEMTAALNEMDALFHSLEHDIAGWRRTPRLQIGQGDIRHKMELLEDMMHHLMHDAGVRSQYLIDADATPPAPESEVIRSQPVRPVQ